MSAKPGDRSRPARRTLERLLRPDCLALFGGRWVENVIEQLQRSGYRGAIWPVHPIRHEIRGLPCVPSIGALPCPPDACFVGVNREASIEVIGQLSALGAGGATCFAAGFLESETQSAGGASLQSRLVAAAGTMPILGPNCYGYLNYLDNVTLWPDQHGGVEVQRGVAIIAQSSNIAINLTMQRRALSIGYVVTAGNQAQTGVYDIGATLIDDPRVSAIGFYLESLGDVRALEALSTRAHQLGKTLVALKSGRSLSAQAATLSHTASLAGSASAASALFERLGIVEVRSLDVFIEALKLADRFGRLQGFDVCSVSCSGGEASHMADIAEASGLQFRAFSSNARQQIARELGPLVSIANPLDYHTFIWGDAACMTRVFSAVLLDGFHLTLFMLDLPRSDRCDPQSYECAIQAIIAAHQGTGAPAAVISCLPENLNEAVSARFLAAGVVPLHGLSQAVAAIDALSALADPGAYRSAPLLLSSPRPSDSAALTAPVVTLDEAAAKNALATFGLPVPVAVRATSVQHLQRLSDSLCFPVALKALGIAHKSEHGAVCLNLPHEQALLEAAVSMGGVTQEYLVEEMVGDTIAELIVGVTRETSGLFQLTLGAGGILAELLNDTVSLLLPVTPGQVHAALNELRIGAVLRSCRGQPGANIDALVEAIMSIAGYAIHTADILVELDVNPLLARQHDAIAVDALIRQHDIPAG